MIGLVSAASPIPIPDPGNTQDYQNRIDGFLKSKTDQEVLNFLLADKAIFEKEQDFPRLVVCLNNIARLYDFITPAKKPPTVEVALKLGQAHLSPNHPALGYTYLLKGEVFLANSQLDSALTWFEKAAKLLEATEQWENLGWAQIFEAVVCYHQGQYWKMEPILLASLEMAQSHLPPNHDVVVQNFQLLAAFTDAVGDYDKALGYGKMALDHRLQIQEKSILDSIFLSDDYNNLANIYSRIGAYKEALTYYQRSIDLRNHIANASRFSIAQSLNNLADLYREQAEFQTAVLWYRKALLSIQSLAPKEKGTLFPVTCQGIASCYSELGQIDSAKYFLRKSYQSNIYQTFLVMGKVLLSANQPDSAKAMIRKALIIFQNEYRDAKGKRLAIIEFELAKAYFTLEEQDSALAWCQSALYRLTTNFRDSTGTSNPKPVHLISKKFAVEILKLKADALSHRKSPGDLKAALASLTLSFKLTEGLRQSYLADGSKHFIAREIKDIADRAVGLCMMLHDSSESKMYLEKAFDFSERSKTILLLESIHTAEMRTFDYIPDSIRKNEATINRKLSFYEARIGEAENQGRRDSLKMKTWRDKVFFLQREKELLLAHLERDYPDYYNFQYAYKITSPGELQSIIRDEEMIIEYFVGRSNLYVFAIRSDRIDMKSVPIPANFDTLVQGFHASISDYGFIASSTRNAWNAYTQFAAQLFQILFPESLFPGGKVPGHITVIPDGALNFIPFEALLTESVDGNDTPDYLRLPYLLRKSVINYAWSGSLMLNTRRRLAPDHPQVCLAMAPGYGATESGGRGGQLRSLSDKPTMLPGAQEEVRAIAEYFDGTYYFGADATKERFEAEANSYSILHLAMHGVPDLKTPLASHLLFAGEEENSKMQAWEIYNLRLSANLVVLSACETGYGKLVEGEGVMSLARSFVQAGASSVVTTLWQVDDQASTELMKEFYRNLSHRDDKAEALHKAKLSFLQNADSRSAHPIYWAGYIHKGNPAPVPLPSRFPWRYLLISFLGIVIIVFIFLLFRKKFSR